MTRTLLAFAVLMFGGCASTDHYNAQREQIAAWERVETARANANARKWDALAHAARDADPATRLAIAITLGGNGGVNADTARAPMPAVTDPSETALRWAAVIMPSVTNIAAAGFGYGMAVRQSDNAAATSIAGYQTMTALGTAGVAGMRDVALGGFSMVSTLPPTSTTTTTTTNNLAVGPGSAGAIGGNATLDNSRRCAPSYTLPITTTITAGTSYPAPSPTTGNVGGGNASSGAVGINNPFNC